MPFRCPGKHNKNSMLDENLIASHQQTLLQTRNVLNRLLVKLHEAEAEVEMLRIEINAIEFSAIQTEKTIERLLDANRSGRAMNIGESLKIEEDFGTATPLYGIDGQRTESQNMPSRGFRRDSVAYINQNRGIPRIHSGFEPVSKRFNDRTITQACTLLLSETGGPLHVNELYNLLIAGGMKFKGNNPTISVAVSLSRSRRFCKVDPGTFDLVMREARQAAS